MSALARIEAREAAEAACAACADTGHVEGYAGRAEHCPCMGHLRAVVTDLQLLGHLQPATIRRVCRAVTPSAAPSVSSAADQHPGALASAGAPGDGERL